jgi:hypothetical protein
LRELMIWLEREYTCNIEVKQSWDR